ncbi:heparinase II/III family protein [Cucumibacter marinus]|uniref:heparinase II/III family protein n=1 Tax=Cucumibacter marinus TaxID=1121252 RepID=UPI00041C921E|nr:heparinase II/III family protein [Cucumibacter marinus]
MSSLLRFLLRKAVLSVADRAVTSPVYRWTWRPLADETFIQALPEICPADAISASDMVSGQYNLGGRLIETGGISPFALEDADPDWLDDLHSFAWLRHFNEATDRSERDFARTLVLDWIGRYGHFNRQFWSNSLIARRTQNWLRHYELITATASDKQKSTIARTLSVQIQALKQRSSFEADPFSRLEASIALLGVSLCHRDVDVASLQSRTDGVIRQINKQLDKDGMHKSRSPKNQFQLLQYLVPIRLALVSKSPEAGKRLAEAIDPMHGALAELTMTTGEPAYFNGTGQLPLELLLSVQFHAVRRNAAPARVTAGYGVAQLGQGKLVCDSGQMPDPEFAAQMHAGGLAFEFSHGNALIVGNCGPAPGKLRDAAAFRQAAAHSTLSVDDRSPARFGVGPFMPQRVFPLGAPPAIGVDPNKVSIAMVGHGFEPKYGLTHHRMLSLIDEGRTLVGQDVLKLGGSSKTSRYFTLRFHLGPGVYAGDIEEQSSIRLETRAGEVWMFLWEGGVADIEESVRQSVHFGLTRTDQIVITGDVTGRSEIAWSFTRQPG